MQNSDRRAFLAEIAVGGGEFDALVAPLDEAAPGPFEAQAQNWRADFPEMVSRIETLIGKYAEPLELFWEGLNGAPSFDTEDGRVSAEAVDYMVAHAASSLDGREEFELPAPTGNFTDLIIEQVERLCETAAYCAARYFAKWLSRADREGLLNEWPD